MGAVAILFRFRLVLCAVFIVLTVLAAWQAAGLRTDAKFEKQLPIGHPYVQTYLDYQGKLPGTNSITLVVESGRPTIWTQKYLRRLYDITDAVSYLPGVFRGSVTSLWTSNTQILETTEDGFGSHNLIPSDFTRRQMSDAAILKMKSEAQLSYYRGRLFSEDNKSSIVTFDLLDVDPDTGKPLDYIAFAQTLDRDIVQKYSDQLSTVRVIGFAKLMGDVADAARNVALFLGLAMAVAALGVLAHRRSLGLALLVAGTPLAALVWLAGLLAASHSVLDPFAVLVPFVVFAVGFAQAAQLADRFVSRLGAGEGGVPAAQGALADAGGPAAAGYLAAAAGVAAVAIAPFPIIREMSAIGLVGLACQLVATLVFLPVLLSGMPGQAGLARRAAPPPAGGGSRISPALVVGAAAVAAVAALLVVRVPLVGDLKPGVAEFRPDAPYNVDSAYYGERYEAGLDNFVVLAETQPEGCINYSDMQTVARFGKAMRDVPGVTRVIALPDLAKLVRVLSGGGSPDWYDLSRVKDILVMLTTPFTPSTGLFNTECTFLTTAIFLSDHRPETLAGVAAAAEAWIAANPEEETGVRWRLATGNGGLLHAINVGIESNYAKTFAAVFGALALACLVLMRDLRGMLVCLLPVAVAWLVAYAAAHALGISLKITTFAMLAMAPVLGIGFALHLHGAAARLVRAGTAASDAYAAAVAGAGRTVLVTALSLAAGTATWLAAELQLQADIGLVLAILYVATAVAVLLVQPALARLLGGAARA